MSAIRKRVAILIVLFLIFSSNTQIVMQDTIEKHIRDIRDIRLLDFAKYSKNWYLNEKRYLKIKELRSVYYFVPIILLIVIVMYYKNLFQVFFYC